MEGEMPEDVLAFMDDAEVGGPGTTLGEPLFYASYQHHLVWSLPQQCRRQALL